MPLKVPTKFHLPSLDDMRQLFAKRWLARSLQADPTRPVDVGPKSLPYTAGAAVADVLYILLADVVLAGKAYLVRNMWGDRLLAYAKERVQIDGLRPAVGSSGFITARSIAVGGAPIAQGTQLFHRPTSLRFEVQLTATYFDGMPIPIVGIDTGPETNLPQGTVIEFFSAPTGVSVLADVMGQNDGFGGEVGLAGGAEAETEEQLQQRVIDAQRNPRSAGNSPQIIFEAERTKGVPVEKAWYIPAVVGPGTGCLLFTVRPATVGGTRIPTSVQEALVEATIRQPFPLDFNLTVATLLDSSVAVAAGITWASGTPGWVDTVPWPPANGANPVKVLSAPAPSNTSARVKALSAVAAPQVGQTFAVYDPATRLFKKKRIGSIIEVVAGTTWDLTFTFSNNASDTYMLVGGQMLSPYSDSLNLLPLSILRLFGTFGPGEQVVPPFVDPGMRQQRFPESPDEWPSVISNAGLVNAFKATRAVTDIEVILPETPYHTPVGVLATTAYLLRMSDLAVYPQT